MRPEEQDGASLAMEEQENCDKALAMWKMQVEEYQENNPQQPQYNFDFLKIGDINRSQKLYWGGDTNTGGNLYVVNHELNDKGIVFLLDEGVCVPLHSPNVNILGDDRVWCSRVYPLSTIPLTGTWLPQSLTPIST